MPIPNNPVVIVEPSPSFAIEAVRDVELRSGVLVRGIGAFEGGPRRLELVAAEEAKPFVKGRLVDLIRADAGGKAAADFRDRLRLMQVDPDNQRGVADARGQPGDADARLAHGGGYRCVTCMASVMTSVGQLALAGSVGVAVTTNDVAPLGAALKT